MHKYSSPTHRSHLWYLPKQQGVLHSITTSVIICTIIWKGAATLRPGRPVHYSDDCWLGWCSEVQGTDGTGKPDAGTIPPLASPAGPHWSPYFRREGAETELEEGKVPWHAGHLNSILPGSQRPCPEKWSRLRPLPQWGGVRQEDSCLISWKDRTECLVMQRCLMLSACLSAETDGLGRQPAPAWPP